MQPVEVDFLNMYKVLVEAGYHVIAFDFRNQGKSGSTLSNQSSIGVNEWEDVAAVMSYILRTPKYSGMQIAHLTYCIGANATIKAMS
jgi:uncharacterized protein